MTNKIAILNQKVRDNINKIFDLAKEIDQLDEYGASVPYFIALMTAPSHEQFHDEFDANGTMPYELVIQSGCKKFSIEAPARVVALSINGALNSRKREKEDDLDHKDDHE